MPYTIEQLCEEGPQFVMPMLIECIKVGEPFVTYGTIRNELQYQLNIETIFPTQIGWVAGTLMSKILEREPNAPLINSLITRNNGIPGCGIGDYFAERYNDECFNDWDNIPRDEIKQVIQEERERIFTYEGWEEINEQLFGLEILQEFREELKYNTNNHHGSAESEDHKRLKEWVANNPKKLGIRQAFGAGEMESHLLSGDSIDVLFSDGNAFRVVEVKSHRSNNEDLRRGLYQCVKYREVKKAEHLPYKIDIQAILVTEQELPPELKERARLLGVKHKFIPVNF